MAARFVMGLPLCNRETLLTSWFHCSHCELPTRSKTRSGSGRRMRWGWGTRDAPTVDEKRSHQGQRPIHPPPHLEAVEILSSSQGLWNEGALLHTEGFFFCCLVGWGFGLFFSIYFYFRETCSFNLSIHMWEMQLGILFSHGLSLNDQAVITQPRPRSTSGMLKLHSHINPYSFPQGTQIPQSQTTHPQHLFPPSPPHMQVFFK